MLKLITAATSLAVSVARAKERLQIDASDFDSDLEALIKTASATVETQCGLALQSSSWDATFSGWPCGSIVPSTLVTRRTLHVPLSPVRDITSLTYVDTNGATQTVSASDYTWDRTPEGASIYLNADYVPPDLGDAPWPITVAFSAGYDDPAASGSGDDPELVLPPQAEMAILFLVGHWFRTREPVSQDQPYTVPQTFDLLASQIRVYR